MCFSKEYILIFKLKYCNNKTYNNVDIWYYFDLNDFIVVPYIVPSVSDILIKLFGFLIQLRRCTFSGLYTIIDSVQAAGNLPKRFSLANLLRFKVVMMFFSKNENT